MALHRGYPRFVANETWASHLPIPRGAFDTHTLAEEGVEVAYYSIPSGSVSVTTEGPRCE